MSNWHVASEGGQLRVTVRGIPDVSDAADLRDALLAAQAPCLSATVDLAEAEHLGCAMLQVLLAFAGLLRESGRSVHWSSLSSSASACLRSAGLDAHLRSPEGAAGGAS